MIKYSIVIPTYNNKELLLNTLEALNDQTGFADNRYEVIVVDDGSDDGTLDYVKDTPRTYRFEYVYMERLDDSCRARVRNAGWRKASGRYVVFLDSDMLVVPEYLRELDRCYEADGDMLVFGYRYMLKEPVAPDEVRSRRIFERSYRALPYLEARYFDSQTTSFNTSALEHPWMFVFSCSMALPRKRLEQLDGFDEGYVGWGMEDTDIGYRCYKLGLRIVSCLGMEALHQYHGEAFGDLRSMRKMIEWDRNSTRMYRIHPALRRELPRWRVNVAYFTRTIPHMLMRRGKARIVYRLVLSNPDELELQKLQIEALGAQPGLLVIVRDELEQPGFHLWLQMLGRTRSEVRYYPCSFTFEREDVDRFFKQVFSWKKSAVLAYRCVLLLGSKLTRAWS